MTLTFSDIFTEIAVLLMLAAIIGAIGVRLRQPLIVVFIAVGILAGPSVLGWMSANDQVLIPYASAAAEAVNNRFTEDNQTASAQAYFNNRRLE